MGGVGSIPVTQIEAYLRLRGVEGEDEKMSYLKFVGVLDSAYLNFKLSEFEKKQKVEEKKNKPPNKRVPKWTQA
jgi:hypothetical protein